MPAVKASFLRISGTLNAFRNVLSTVGYSSISWQVPPAASIFSRAVFEKAWACTVSAFEISPWPRILTGTSRRVARFFSRRESGVTSDPLSKRASRSRRLTGWVWVRNFSNGIDFFMCGPRSLRIRMWIGVWPPSKLILFFAPEREPAPLWPRPEVLPVPEPWPRPTRLRGLREPGAGFSEWSPIRSAIYSHQMLHCVHQTTNRGVIFAFHGSPDLSQTKCLQRLGVLAARARGRLHLSDDELGHQAGASSGSPASPGTGLSLSPSSRLSIPSTSRTVRPRSSATWSGLRRPWRAATVAFTRLIGFWLPSDFESTSWMPASSSTARTPPPAITPVPAEAGFRSTREAECTPIVSCVMVAPCIGTLKRFLRARSTPFWIATGTSLALP